MCPSEQDEAFTNHAIATLQDELTRRLAQRELLESKINELAAAITVLRDRMRPPEIGMAKSHG